MRLLIILALFFAPIFASAQDTLTQERWLRHLKEDLLPFWDMPTAHGDPIGLYPSMRCNDGSIFQESSPCPEIKDIGWMTPDQNFLIAISRQSFAYLTAFHLTGDQRYLALGKAGVDILMGPARNPDGGHYEGFDQKSETWWYQPQRFTIQKQAYGLLAPAFYYYLTRDPDVLTMIEETRQTMMVRYRDPDTKEYFFKEREITEKNTATAFVSYLDQINTFYMLMAPTLEEPLKSDWIGEMDAIAGLMMTKFYSPRFHTFFLDGTKATEPDIEPKVDFGHSAKAHWFLMMNGAVTENAALSDASRAAGKKVLNKALRQPMSTWRDGLNRRGKPNNRQSAWIFAEQNQLLASLALEEPRLRTILNRTYAYWLRGFVDPEFGGVFDMLDKDGLPIKQRPKPKHWAWKSGFHEFEHALVAYITASQFEGKPLKLHYAFSAQPNAKTIRPYYFSGDPSDLQRRSDGVTVVTFDSIAFP